MLINDKKVKEIKDKIKNGIKLKRTENIHYNSMPDLRKYNLDYVYNHVELLEIARCYDIEYFIEKYIDINLFEHQKNIIKLFKENRFSIVLKARQTGVDTILMILFLHHLLFNNDKVISLIGIKNISSKEKIKIFKRYYKKLPFFLQKGIVSWNELNVKLDNGGRIIVNSSIDNVGYGIDILHIDELSRFNPTLFERFESLIPSITCRKDSKIIISSTPNGYNKFYDMVSNSERDENHPLKNTYKTLRVYWNDVPNRGEEWKKKQISLIGGKEYFNQEYELKFIR